jgi:hypothetical protein
VRFGKPVAGAFTFALVDLGVRAGIFKKHGLELEISAFTGGTRLVQARPPAASTSRSIPGRTWP